MHPKSDEHLTVIEVFLFFLTPKWAYFFISK